MGRWCACRAEVTAGSYDHGLESLSPCPWWCLGWASLALRGTHRLCPGYQWGIREPKRGASGLGVSSAHPDWEVVRKPQVNPNWAGCGLDGLLRVAVEGTSGHTQSESSLEGRILGIGSFMLILSFLQHHLKSIFIRLIYLLDKYSSIIFVCTDNLLINTMFQAFSAVADRPSLSL